MGATWRPWVNDSDALANGEASNNAIEVARNWRRCIDLEFIGGAERGARSAQSDFFILINLRRSQPPRGGGRPSSSSKDFSSTVRYKVLKVILGCLVSPNRQIDTGYATNRALRLIHN